MTGTVTIDVQAVWGDSLADVTEMVTSPAQRRWLAETHPIGMDNDTVVLAAPHSFAQQWLTQRCRDRLRAVLSRTAGRELNVVITVQPNAAPYEHDPQDPPGGAVEEPAASVTGAGPGRAVRPPVDGPPAVDRWFAEPSVAPTGPTQVEPTEVRPLQAPGRPPGHTVELHRPADDLQRPAVGSEPEARLNPKYVFDRFVIGASNRFAHAAAFAVAEAPARAYNPLFIYGGAGLGKTHLLNAIGHYVKSLYPRLRIRYLTTEQFTNAFINAIRDDQVIAFQRTYRQADILLIDDIQFLASKERTQEEFFHTFNSLHNAEKQIVITSDRPPKQIAQLEDRLRSRFEWGLITDIQPPDLETRIAILRKKASYENLEVPGEVLELIADRVQSNIRELEGALIRVTAFASLQRQQVGRDLAELVLKDLFPSDTPREISVTLIQNEVARYFGLTVDDLCSPSRSRSLVTARQIAMYLVRELTELSLPKIGKAFGGRDHTTVMHAVDKIARLMRERRAIYDQVEELTGRVRTRTRSA